jgi:IAA-amino acid hydrolase
MGGEDFAFIAQKVPAAYTFLGIRNETLGSVWPLHSPHFKLDEGVLPVGAAYHAALAFQYFEKHAGGAGEKEL